MQREYVRLAAMFGFALILTALPAAAQNSSPQNPQPNASQHVEDETRTRALLESLQRQTEENRELLKQIREDRESLQELENDVRETQIAVTQAKLELSNNYFGIFREALFIILGAAAVIATLAALVGIPQAIQFLENKFERRLKRKVRDAAFALVDETSNDATARSLGQFSYVWGQGIFRKIIDFLHEKTDGEEIRESLSLVTWMAHHSVECVDRLKKSKSTRATHQKHVSDLEENILNIWVFYKSIDILLRERNQQDVPAQEVESLLKRARHLQQHTRSQPYSERLLNRINTVNFALVKFGSDRERRRAGKELLDLFSREENKPSLRWRQFAYDFYFPVDEHNRNKDIHTLGGVPAKPSE
jgi:hypothetical protein